MIKKIMLASCLLVASMASQAALISYNGYERDTANNYVTGGGLEWLMWDVTKGKSINEAIAAHGANGWELANNTQMASLFNVFKFDGSVWNANENVTQNTFAAWTAGEDGPYRAFVQMFGYTSDGPVTDTLATDPWLFTNAFYGNDGDADGQYNFAVVFDDYSMLWGDKREGAAGLAADSPSVERYTKWDFGGVALVREARVVPPAQVSLPGSLSLLALGLVAFGVRRRQLSRR